MLLKEGWTHSPFRGEERNKSCPQGLELKATHAEDLGATGEDNRHRTSEATSLYSKEAPVPL